LLSQQFQNSWALTVDSATLLCQAALKVSLMRIIFES
jgi:hypothetical protein